MNIQFIYSSALRAITKLSLNFIFTSMLTAAPQQAAN